MKKLLDIQLALKAPKSNTNDFGHYKYRSCEDIVEAVKPLCSTFGAVLLMKDSIELIGDRYYVKAVVSLFDSESGQEIASASAYAREEDSKKGMDASQISGCASSYARKYALCGLFAIDDGVDADKINKGETSVSAPATTTQKKPSDDYPWFNDPDLEKFIPEVGSEKYPTADVAVKVLRESFKVSTAMVDKIKKLYSDVNAIKGA